MIKLLIIADDFTGALDTCVSFAEKHIPARVLTARKLEGCLPEDTEVLAVDTETRHLPAWEAYGIVRDIARAAVEAGIPYLYKKVDSTLRGNVGAEIAAVMDAAESESFYFAPAFPANGRTTVNGQQLVDGVALHRSVFAQDPLEPMVTSDIAEILHRQTEKPICHAEAASLPRIWESHQPGICVLDASCQEELCSIAAFVAGEGHCLVMGGSAGFAAGLSDSLPLRCCAQADCTCPRAHLFLVGSVNQVSLDQIDRAARQGYPLVRLTFEQQLSRDYYQRGESAGLLDAIMAALLQKRQCIVSTLDNRSQLQDAAQYARRIALDPAEVSTRIAANMGVLVQQLLRRPVSIALIVFGGDTLLGIMQAIRCRCIIPIRELRPGIVLSRAVCEDGTLTLVTKAGGFGTVDTIPYINKCLDECTSPITEGGLDYV